MSYDNKASRETGVRAFQQILSSFIDSEHKTSSVRVADDDTLQYNTRDGTVDVQKIGSTTDKKVITYDSFKGALDECNRSGKNVYFYIIDMQEDFVDGGAFGVAGGNAMTRDVVYFLGELKSMFGGRLTVRLTRDYHPGIRGAKTLDSDALAKMEHLNYMGETREGRIGHCSFFKENETTHSPGFPRHCEQGSSGSLIVGPLNKESLYDSKHDMVLFKGIYDTHDCFAGFPYQSEDDFTNSQLHACKHEHKPGDYVNSGGHLLEGKNNGTPKTLGESLQYNGKSLYSQSDGKSNDPLVFMGKGDKRYIAKKISEEEHLPGIKDGDVVIVVGLAGDFCVLNTATNIRNYLAKKSIKSNVYVPQSLTRYPLLPYIAVTGVPEFTKEHNTLLQGVHTQKPKVMNSEKFGDLPVGTSLITGVDEEGNVIFYEADKASPDGSVPSDIDTYRDILSFDVGFYVSDDTREISKKYGNGMILVDYPSHGSDSAGKRKTKRRKYKKSKGRSRRNKRARHGTRNRGKRRGTRKGPRR